MTFGSNDFSCEKYTAYSVWPCMLFASSIEVRCFVYLQLKPQCHFCNENKCKPHRQVQCGWFTVLKSATDLILQQCPIVLYFFLLEELQNTSSSYPLIKKRRKK